MATVSLYAALTMLLVILGLAQQDPTTYEPLCSKTFADANATGIYNISPDLYIPTEPDFTSNPVSWAYTVTQNSTLLSATIWYNTGGANYTDEFSLGYDVCGFRFGDPGALTRQAHWEGQGDEGDCKRALSEECVGEWEELGRRTASGNLQLDACPINSTTADSNPAQPGSKDWNAWWSVQQIFAPANNSAYDALNQAIFTYMTIFLPIANRERVSTVETKAFMTCLHTDHYNPGSRVTAAVPSPANTGSGNSLSGGAIAGIVIGAVSGVALIAVGVWFFCRRRSRKSAPQASQTREASAASELSSDSTKSPISEVDNSLIREMSADFEHQKVEMAAAQVHAEKDGDPVHVELEGSRPQVVELPAQSDVKR
ncbi:hypothetical protein PRZ48_007692 [Zasmidium cellare]|uniref:Uncharacterized protein n=1 Tax=Zasmidium cellare TaxID=395010 RepID=A0ABR0EL69_ZASCE|nr:hypothetical protein PRZ48_007692 [Zasmidium cellare]